VKQLIARIMIFLMVPLVAIADESLLIHLIAKDQPVENGKVLDIEFHEVDREAESSTVQIIRHTGGSVSSSMFVLKGMCAIARSRGEQYFVAEKVVGNNELFTVTFPKAPTERGKGFSLSQCDLMRY
jgi:hypothetical protein